MEFNLIFSAKTPFFCLNWPLKPTAEWQTRGKARQIKKALWPTNFSSSVEKNTSKASIQMPNADNGNGKGFFFWCTFSLMFHHFGLITFWLLNQDQHSSLLTSAAIFKQLN